MSSVEPHGRRLECFRPLERYHMNSEPLDVDAPLACDCHPEQVFECVFAPAQDPSASDLVLLHDNYVQRLVKWGEKYKTKDWSSPRVCQKWRENQLKFHLETETSATTSDEDDDVDVPWGAPPLSNNVKLAFNNFASAAEALYTSRQFDALLRSGVPPPLRGQVWYMCSGGQSKRETSPTSYCEYLTQEVADVTLQEIEKDLPRTFPHHDSKHELRRRNLEELRRILQAYSVRNPSIGYCQSMNFLAAVLLHHMREEEAFWVLCCVVEDLLPGFHTRSMAGSRAEQRVFAQLVRQKLPTLYAHLQHLHVDVEPFTLKWFLCLFLNTLPFEPVLRLWDVFFCEGSHVLLRMGLVLLKLREPWILACEESVDVYELLRFPHAALLEMTKPYRARILSKDECVCDTLLRLAMDRTFVGGIAFDCLHELRSFHRLAIEAEFAEEEEARKMKDGSDTEYDFVDEYEGDMSPSKVIRFQEMSGQDDYFVNVRCDRLEYM